MSAITRDDQIKAFLEAAGWGRAVSRPMGADWSSRRYERLRRDGATAVLMDADGPAAAQVPAFVRVCALLRDAGLSAPEVLAADVGAGLLLLEDFGDRGFDRLLEDGGEAVRLYELATDTLIRLHTVFCPAIAADLPVYDALLFRRQVRLFADAFVPAATGGAGGYGEALDRCWAQVLEPACEGPTTLMLRDYHPGNLMLLEEREGVRRCGLLDVQDAGVGPIAYDLVSLLEDARRDVAPAVARAMRTRYLAAFPCLNRDRFEIGYVVLGAVRHARILGRVAELAGGGKPIRQLAFLPRVWRQLAAKLTHPALAPVARWVGAHLPADGGLPRLMGDTA